MGAIDFRGTIHIDGTHPLKEKVPDMFVIAQDEWTLTDPA